MKQSYFAGGCFWCVEHDFRDLDGVLDVCSGYSSDTETIVIPSYNHHKGFSEAVRVDYDEEKISYKKLCQFFLDHIDPTDVGGQFYDRGESYKTVLYFETESEEDMGRDLINEMDKSGMFDKKIVVEIRPLLSFTEAEEYHQNYASKNSDHYMNYRIASGREKFITNTCELRKKFPWKS